ncbi:hypothetical protein JTY60_01980 [symbiont of Argiope bruennichi]|uniref:copper homeostasis protein CutC n=1 Tax=symbiont of Argiope bruennichi TaxID=2810479 RepID=UPI003DA5EE02
MEIEIIVTSLDDLKIVNFFNQKYPDIFTRVELCKDLEKNGFTANYETIEEISKYQTNLKIFALIRRSESYFFDENSYFSMIKDIEYCKSLNIYGVVIGLITKDLTIDQLNIEKIKKISHPLEVTFHKAFDHVKDYQKSINILKNLNINYCLTVCDSNEKFLEKNLKNLLTIRKIFPNLIIGGGVDLENIKIILKNNFKIAHLGKAVRENNSFKNPISFTKMEKLAKLIKERNIHFPKN